eukprot:TRINITY_DN18041_c0_g1_i2.p1 TRINITY_DN18041_c0_g1~~TRINITY_DN18041_c0_g1_i2.p1  ORF type:complete len:280 (-),score=41.78 TRINITY_DN18041_c0_g1_i2:293-1054(-)
MLRSLVGSEMCIRDRSTGSNRSSPMSRTVRHSGQTARKSPGNMEILFDAEIEDIGCMDKCRLCCCMECSYYDEERSYLYIRENSIEYNIAYHTCCASERCGKGYDGVVVTYFDRPPFRASRECCPVPCCCFCQTHEPKFEVLDLGTMCCCKRCPRGCPCHCCCRQRSLVIMPFETYCGCCSNRIGCCGNCCGFCGGITGNPKIYAEYAIQPKDPDAFVTVASRVMGTTSEMVQQVQVAPAPQMQVQVAPTQHR